MILNEYVQAHCGGKPGELRRQIHQITGTLVPWPLVWAWCRHKKPSRVGEAEAALIVAATKGLVTKEELIDRTIIAQRFFPLIGPKQLVRMIAAGKLVPPPPAAPGDESAHTRLLNELAARCAAVEQERATATRARATVSERVRFWTERVERSAPALGLQRALEAEQRAIEALAKARERIDECRRAVRAAAKEGPTVPQQRLEVLRARLQKADERVELADRAFEITKQALAAARRPRKGRAA